MDKKLIKFPFLDAYPSSPALEESGIYKNGFGYIDKKDVEEESKGKQGLEFF